MLLQQLLELCGDTFVLALLEDLLVFVLEEDPKCIRKPLCPPLLLGVLEVKEDRLDHPSEFDLDKERVQVKESLI